jgi:RNA polymerase sigma-70 factor (ECF subfamily)
MDSEIGRLLTGMRPELLGLARRMTRDEDAAADVVQRAFLQVVRNLARFEGRSSFRTWVWRIVVNEALQWRRERLRHARVCTAYLDCGDLESAWNRVTPFDAVERRRSVERVLDALARLSPDDRASIDRVISRSSMGSSSARVRSKLHRARQRLRAALEEGA